MAHLLAFETTADGEMVSVHADVEGLRTLIKTFQWLLSHAEAGNPEHEHLMTPDWGGGELASEPQSTDDTTRVVHHVKLYGWPNAAGQRAYLPFPEAPKK